MLTFIFLPLGHGSVSIPQPRQAIDGDVAPWNGTVPQAIPFMFWCATPDSSEHISDPRNVTGSNGQACFFFNNGCDISCDKCDGRTGQVVHPKFTWNGTGPAPDWSDPTKQLLPNLEHPPISHGARPDDPTSQRLSICKEPKRKATICAPELRTLNPDAPCHSATDYFQYAPWRAPGSAPVHDACGVAGGVLPGQGPAAAGGDYQPTVNVKRGDLGSKLPPRRTGTVWRAGEEVEVAWVQKAWHGGGAPRRGPPLTRELSFDFILYPPPSTLHPPPRHWLSPARLPLTLPARGAVRRLPVPALSCGCRAHRGVLPEPPGALRRRLEQAALGRRGRRGARVQRHRRVGRHAPRGFHLAPRPVPPRPVGSCRRGLRIRNAPGIAPPRPRIANVRPPADSGTTGARPTSRCATSPPRAATRTRDRRLRRATIARRAPSRASAAAAEMAISTRSRSWTS